MDFALSEERLLLQSTFARLFAAHEGEAGQHALWATLVALGAPMLRVGESAGGSGLGLLDAILLLEQAGRHGIELPIAETLVAARLLAQLDGPVAARLVREIAGGLPIALAPQDCAPGAHVVVGGADRAETLLFRSGERLLCGRLGPESRANARFGAALVDPHGLEGVEEIAGGDAAIGLFEAAGEEWRLLGAARLIGAARRALEVAAAYAAERHAFGRPIGSYQGLAHPLADIVTEIDGARLLTWRAVWEIARDDRNAAATSALATWSACSAAPRALILAMRVFGGYGVATDNPAARLYEQGRALAARIGDPAERLATAADRLWGGATVLLPAAGDPGPDFGASAEAEALGEEARSFFALHFTPELAAFARSSLDGYEPGFLRRLAEAGLLYPEWPEEHGGRGASAEAQAAVRGVFNAVDWPMQPIGVTDLVGKMLIRFGGPRVMAEVVPRLARGEAFCCLGYTEPSCGSDIFAATTRAVRDGEDWLINGQKLFTTNGHFADYALVIARTDPDLPKHRGVTLFLVPLDQPGYQWDALPTIAHYRTNITHYVDVRVPDAYRLGEVNGGARTLAAALTLEQNAGDHLVSGLQRLLANGLACARRRGPGGRVAFDRAEVRSRFAALVGRLRITQCLAQRTIWAARAGISDKSHGPMVKLFGSESWLSASQDLIDMLGPDAFWSPEAEAGSLDVDSRRGILSTIYGGTSEIQRSLVAEAALGLPRSRS